MSDATVLILVSHTVTIVTMVTGLLTIWIKLKYGINEAKDAATKAEVSVTKAAENVKVVENKLDANTATTESVNEKTNTIVGQTNGALDEMKLLVKSIAERVGKIEDYDRANSHRLIDALNAVHLKVAEVATLQKLAMPVVAQIQAVERLAEPLKSTPTTTGGK